MGLGSDVRFRRAWTKRARITAPPQLQRRRTAGAVGVLVVEAAAPVWIAVARQAVSIEKADTGAGYKTCSPGRYGINHCGLHQSV